MNVAKRKPDFVPKFLEIIVKVVNSTDNIKKVILEKSMTCIKDLVTFFGFLTALVPHFKKYVDPVMNKHLMVRHIIHKCITQVQISSLYNEPRYRCILTALMTESWIEYEQTMRDV